MENKINIAELLRDCPKGMELDCTIFNGKVCFEGIDDSNHFCPIKISVNLVNIERLDIWGQYSTRDYAQCVIFPKGKTTWEGFVPPCIFKDGDILIHGDCTFIYNGFENNMNYGTYVIIDSYGALAINIPTKKYGARFATEKEKELLFKAIKDNGYKWNPKTKTLEKLIEPKFKVGDKIRYKADPIFVFNITNITKDKYECGKSFVLRFANQDEYELVPNKFDITNLVPFEDKVLVRNDESQRWLPAFWGYKVVDGFITTFGWCKYCIPYKDNEKLFKTNNDCDDFYKTWE